MQTKRCNYKTKHKTRKQRKTKEENTIAKHKQPTKQ